MRPKRAVSAARPPLLCFSGVAVRCADGGRSFMLVQDICFELEAGQSAGLYGVPRSGKSTLLRLACGIESPAQGEVRFEGQDLRKISSGRRWALLRDRIALLAPQSWLPSPGETALDCVAVALGSGGVSMRDARRRAHAGLERVGAAACAQEPAASLSLFQRALVALARAIVHEPLLLLVDEPAPLPSIGQREQLCALLREIANERGMVLLVASEDMSALQGLDVLMSISAGRLCSTARPSSVVTLMPRRAAAGRRS
jgi:ABC-type lipoprotein export system ATPase subunit